MRATKFRKIATWIVRILLVALFLMTGGHKLFGDPMMVDMFGKIGFGQGFRILTGAVEVVAALMVLWPRTRFLATMVMFAVLAGAFVVQLFLLHGDVIHVIVIAGLVGLLVWLQRPEAQGSVAAGDA